MKLKDWLHVFTFIVNSYHSIADADLVQIYMQIIHINRTSQEINQSFKYDFIIKEIEVKKTKKVLLQVQIFAMWFSCT